MRKYFEVDIKIVFKIITKMKRKINLYTKGTLNDILDNITKFNQSLKIFKFTIKHSQPISHTST